jgi:hypothetical protein
LSDRYLAVDLERRIVVDRPTDNDAAVPVIGVLAQTEIADDDEVVAELGL